MKTENIKTGSTTKTLANTARNSQAKAPKLRVKKIADIVRAQIDQEQTNPNLPQPVAYCGYARGPDGKSPQEVLVMANRNGVLHAVMIPWNAIINESSDPGFEQELVNPVWKLFRSKKARGKLFAVLRDYVKSHVLVLAGDGYHTVMDRSGQQLAEVMVRGDKALLISGELPLPIFIKPSESPFKVTGTLQGWQEGVGRHFPEHPRLLLVVLAALAPLLAKLLGATCPALFLYGSSSTGKSTLLRVASSVVTASGSLTTASGTKLGVREVAQRNQG